MTEASCYRRKALFCLLERLIFEAGIRGLWEGVVKGSELYGDDTVWVYGDSMLVIEELLQ